jgi:hypothetical protein
MGVAVMARKQKQAPTNLQPKGLQMGFAKVLDPATLPLPKHPLVGFKFERDSVQPRDGGSHAKP